jgi:hypothetical protein
MKVFKKLLFLPLLLWISACATMKMQVAENQVFEPKKNTIKIEHSFYLIGDAGNSTLQEDAVALTYLKKHLKNASKEATLIFLGDNVYETGIPEEKSKNYPLAKRRIEAQIKVAQDFSGKSIFIPGNHDWYHGLEGLKREQEIVEKVLGNQSFLPNNGCVLEHVTISKDIVLIIVDTHWYLTNWNKHPTINNDCEIKTKTEFLEKFEELVQLAKGKTTIIAMHHPMFTNGPHGGKYSFISNMKPLPILGSIKNLIRKNSGISNTDLQNKKYTALKNHLVAICQQNNKTIFVSGHDHSLQYLFKDKIPQIVSGSGSKTSATKLTGAAKFTYGAQGFAKLDIYEDGSSIVSFYTVKDQKIVYQTQVLSHE